VLLAGVAGVIVLAAVSLGYVLLTYDDEDYRALLITTVERFSDHTLTIGGPFHLELSSEPGISLSELRLVSASGDLDVTVGDLQTKIELRPLLSQLLVVRYFRVSNADVYLEESTDTGDEPTTSESEPSDLFITPIIHGIALDNIRVRYKSHSDPEPVDIKLVNFGIKEISDGNPLELEAAGQISDTEFTLVGRLGDLQRLLDTDAPYPLSVDLKLPRSSLSVDGVIGNPHDGAGLDLAIEGKAPALEKILALFQLEPPPLGALSVTARLEGDVNAPSVSDIELTLSGEKLSLAASGNNKDSLNLRGLDLQGSLNVTDPAILKWLLPKEIPPLDSAKLSALVRSEDADYIISDLIAAVTGRKGLAVNLDGGARISQSDEPLQNIEAEVKFKAQDTSAIRHFSDDVPLAGPVSLTALISGSSKQLSIKKMHLRAGDEKSVFLDAKGNLALDDLLGAPALGTLEIKTTLSAKSTAALSDIAGTKIPDLGGLKVNTLLSHADGHPRLKDLDLRLTKGKEISLHTTGVVGKLNTMDGIDIKMDLSATNLAALGKPFSQTLPDEGPVKLNARITGHSKDINLKGQIDLARTSIKTDIRTLLGAVRPKVTGTLTTPVLHIGDLGLHPAVQPSQTATQTKQSPSGPKSRLFSTEPLELGGMKTTDADLKIAIHRIQGTEKLFNDLDTRIKLDNGLLEIKPLKLTYDGGEIVASATVNSRTRPARMSLKIDSNDLKIGTLLKQKDSADVPLRGFLSTDIDVSSEGKSMAALAANLNGNINLMSENAEVKRHYVELLAKDVLGSVFSSILDQGKMVNIDCGLLITHAERGVVKTKTFLLDSSVAEIRVDGSVDLGKESIQATIYPKQKGRLWDRDKPIVVSGSLSAPKIEVQALSAVGDITTTAAESALLAPVQISGDLFGSILGQGDNRDTKQKGGCSRFLKAAGK
jgi:uncharacterized protein involved in outer membrane biogenesis